MNPRNSTKPENAIHAKKLMREATTSRRESTAELSMATEPVNIQATAFMLTSVAATATDATVARLSKRDVRAPGAA